LAAWVRWREDLFYKLLKSEPVLADQGRYHLLFEQHPSRTCRCHCARRQHDLAQAVRVQTCQGFADSEADAVLIPCFASQTFMDELKAELDIPVVD
jgi:aspartate racemase